MPDGCVDLLWRDGEVQLVGPDRAAWLAPLPAGAAIAGLRLRPGSAPLLLGRMPADEVRDLRVPLAEVAAEAASGGGNLTALAEQLAASGSARQAAGILDEYVAALAHRYQADEAVARAISELSRTKIPAVPDLAEHAGLSERQLRRRFTSAVGYAPKTLHAVLRFQYALRLGRTSDGRLAEVAHEAGYADQAHFTREVRRLAGTTPGVLLGTDRRPGTPAGPGGRGSG
ncbi:helix-turn-helix transcriptional regulator [Catenulispora yoronensis]|uniref:Helix-turn-helix transcriptional regulator n=1 Tax=Catenulispora yoronensis TaxID=450799 RepID=A0ABN2UWS9_9ACTN